MDELRVAMRNYVGPILCVAPTGSGKTNLFCFIASQVSQKEKRVGILVHRRELIKQTCKTLTAWDVHHGVIAADWRPYSAALTQVCSIQTLARRSMPDPDIILVDEAHHTTAETWMQVLARYPNAFVIGFTATPCRMSGAGLGTFFKQLVMGPKVSWLIEQGHLVRPRCLSLSLADPAGLTARAGEYKIEDMARLMNTRKIVGDAVEHYAKYLAGRPAIVFGVHVQHCEDMAEMYRGAGLRAVAVDGSLDAETRDRRIGGLSDGRTQVLMSCELVSEGLDIPVVAGCQMLRPTKSTALYLQQVGRVLRPAEGKTEAIILDHVGNVWKHFPPDMDREWSLDGGLHKPGNGGAEGVELVHCPECASVVFGPARQCPHCGFSFPVVETDALPIQVVGGELKEITIEDVTALMARAEKSGRLSDMTKAFKAKAALEGVPYDHKKTYAAAIRRNGGQKPWEYGKKKKAAP